MGNEKKNKYGKEIGIKKQKICADLINEYDLK